MSAKRETALHPQVPVAVLSRRLARRVEVIGVPVFSDLTGPEGAGVLLDPVFLSQRRFEGRPGQAQAFPADGGSVVVALGVGTKGSIAADDLRCAAAALARNAGNAGHVATTLPSAAATSGGITDAQAVKATVEGFGLASYLYAGAPPAKRAGTRAERLSVVSSAAGAQEALRRAQTSVEAAWRARDLVNSPANELTPRELARVAVSDGEAAGLRVDVWDERRIARERLGGLRGVAGGATEPPRLIRMAYTPDYTARPPGRVTTRRRRAAFPRIHLVGKGITFDSGGLSLKPAASMMTMKDDMGGAAAVICATVALAKLQVAAEVVAWVAATENMPSGTAIHPGDVITTRNSKTVEVLNTDAEGRLVLADALALAVEENPDAVVDVATLTGGQRVALGDRIAAVMGTDPQLVERLVAAGKAAGEPCWELPLHPGYRKHLESDVADLKNVASGPAASAIMAGLFLGEFAAGSAWAHLDIAGPAWSDSEDQWICRGATGWGTRTLIELVAGW